VSETANPTKVGLFVVGAAALALATMVAFGSSKLFATTEQFEIHFDQSLMGLSLGAPVIFQGVQVGTVVDLYAEYATDDPLQIETPVIVELVGGRVRRPQNMPGPRDSTTVISELVGTGLRAQLDVQSLVTGQLYVSLVIRPDTPIQYHGDGNLPEIPSITSDLEMVKETFLSLVKELRLMPLQEIGDDLVSVLAGLADLANAPETREGLEQLGAAMSELRALVDSMNSKLDGGYAEYMKVTAEVQVVLKGAGDTIESVQRLVEPGSELQYQLDVSLQEVRRALERVGALADQLLAQPDSVLFGRGQKKQ
jgi:paraquat-inducible protein B